MSVNDEVIPYRQLVQALQVHRAKGFCSPRFSGGEKASYRDVSSGLGYLPRSTEAGTRWGKLIPYPHQGEAGPAGHRAAGLSHPLCSRESYRGRDPSLGEEKGGYGHQSFTR